MGAFQDALRRYCPVARESGKELKEIAAELTNFLGEAVSVDQVRWALKTAGYRTPIQKLDDHRELILEKSAGGWSDAKIGRKIGFSKDQVYAWRRKHGVVKAPVKRPKRSAAVREGRQRYWRHRRIDAVAMGWPHVPHPGKARILEACWKATDADGCFLIKDVLAELGVKGQSPAFWYLRDRGLVEPVRGRRGVWRLLAERQTLEEFESKLRQNFPSAGAMIAEAVSKSVEKEFTGPNAVSHRWYWAVGRIKSKAGITERNHGVHAGDVDYNFSDDGSVL